MTRTIQRSLQLLQLEMTMTSVLMSLPIMNLFFTDHIGMNMSEIGISQAVCAVALCLANVPTGWLADRFSRKACNIIGDAGVVGALLFYAAAQTFSDVIIAELAFGIAAAFSNGADAGLLRAYCNQLGTSYARVNARVNSWRPLVEIAGVSVGGLVGAYQPRLAIALSAIPFAVGAIISTQLVEVGEKRTGNTQPLRDMGAIVWHSLWHNRPLRWSLVAAVIARESTHPLVWLFTPLLLLAGVPPQIVGIAWALNLVAQCGRELAARTRGHCCSGTGKRSLLRELFLRSPPPSWRFM